MSWTTIDAETLTPEHSVAWAVGARAGTVGEGAVLTAGPHTALVGPAEAVDAWLRDRYGDDGVLVRDLACFVYHRKGWFDPGLDPMRLRDRRPGQYELRVWTDTPTAVVPLFAMDLAPVRHRGTFATLDQRTPNPAASLTEIAVVPADQPVLVAGAERRLGDLACGTDRLWEASRLGSVSELVRLTPSAREGEHAVFRRLARSLDAVAALDAGDVAAAHAAGRALFGLTLAWAAVRLPVDLVLGLSQGNVVRAFAALLCGGDRDWHPLDVAGWHENAAAFQYAPGYFATGAVQGYSMDLGASVDDMVELGLRRLARVAPAGRSTAA